SNFDRVDTSNCPYICTRTSPSSVSKRYTTSYICRGETSKLCVAKESNDLNVTFADLNQKYVEIRIFFKEGLMITLVIIIPLTTMIIVRTTPRYIHSYISTIFTPMCHVGRYQILFKHA